MRDRDDHDDNDNDSEPESPSTGDCLASMGRRGLSEGGCPDGYQNNDNILIYKKVIEQVWKG